MFTPSASSSFFGDGQAGDRTGSSPGSTATGVAVVVNESHRLVRLRTIRAQTIRKDRGSHQPRFRAAIPALLAARMLKSSDRPIALGSTTRVVTSSCLGFPANLQLYWLEAAAYVRNPGVIRCAELAFSEYSSI